MTTTAIKNHKEAHIDIIIEPGDKFDEGCLFLEKLIVQENDELDKNDFLTLRGKPFYKIKNGIYRIIFNLFVVEKIFKGIYFLLRNVNKNLPEGSRIKEIKSFYGEEFSEKVLCYKVIESIYLENCIRFSGKDLADRKIDAAPDYYVRKGKNILLFESKDFLIAAEKKMSFDFAVYEEEFGRILDYEELPDGKIKPKAIMQLINNVRRVLKNQFTADTNYYYKDVFIYPVLITHDLQFDAVGFNELIDFWFQDALSELENEGLFVHHVKPLSVVNIDSIIYNQVGLSKHIFLHDVLSEYQQSKIIPKQKKKIVKTQEEYEQFMEDFKQRKMSTVIPFSLFIDRFFKEHNLWKLPPLLDIVAPNLFKEEYEEGKYTKR
ncbi:MAG: hypothetical protein QM764_00675 [Chitinophagaceae bacterium]